MTVTTFPNRLARHIWLHRHGLSTMPDPGRGRGPAKPIIERLGMVQIDTIRTVARSHDHILWSRAGGWREPQFNRLLATDRSVFEHFSHDAVILPIETWPWWQRQCRRRAQSFRDRPWARADLRARTLDRLLRRIEAEGPVCARDFNDNVDRSTHAWMRSPSKIALDYLWLAGDLAVSHRSNFQKFYDLSERVIPEQLRARKIPDEAQVDWLCEGALRRLGFASAGEIQRFWDACSLAEVQSWIQQQGKRLMPLEWLSSDGRPNRAVAFDDELETLFETRPPVARLRIINPFDPAVRDRKRLKALFGMDYRIEIFVPASRRRYGYYVYPVLDGDRMVARIDARALDNANSRSHSSSRLQTRSWWLEPGVRKSRERERRLHRELQRLARLSGVDTVDPLPSPATPGSPGPVDQA